MLNQLGFSLIELMIVITIISILATIAIPSYQNYTQRARFAEVIIATEPFKTAVSLALQNGVDLSEIKNGMHGIPPSPASTNNLKNIVVENGVITSTSTQKAGNHTYIMYPNENNFSWSVGGTCVKEGFCEP